MNELAISADATRITREGSGAHGSLEHLLPEWPRIWGTYRRRARSWAIPPRWTPADWREEVDAEALAAAYKALRRFDPSRGTTINSYVYHQALHGALARYRQEWNYARRCSATADAEHPVPVAEDGVALNDESELLRRNMGRLVDDDRLLLVRLYWEGWSEAEIADVLGISQQAVSKRKRKILSVLRGRFRVPCDR